MAVFMVIHIDALLAVAIGTFDVTGAYLEPFNDYENYAWISSDIMGKPLRVCVIKALYGEKQAGKLWYEFIANVLSIIGFVQCTVSSCLFRW